MIRIDPTVLDEARQRYGLTSDEQLAARVGVSGRTIGNLRAGTTTPTLRTLMSLKAATGRPLDALVEEFSE